MYISNLVTLALFFSPLSIIAAPAPEAVPQPFAEAAPVAEPHGSQHGGPEFWRGGSGEFSRSSFPSGTGGFPIGTGGFGPQATGGFPSGGFPSGGFASGTRPFGPQATGGTGATEEQEEDSSGSPTLTSEASGSSTTDFARRRL